MNPINEASGQPNLADLLARFLTKQAADHADGLAPEPAGEVVPFEAAPVHPVDARLAWEEAVEALAFYNPQAPAWSGQAPPHWAQLVMAHEPVVSLAFCLGNFPQMVRNFQPLLQAADPVPLRPVAGRPVTAPALLSWADDIAARKHFPQTLLALGALRLAKHHDHASALLRAHEADVPAEWQAGWANEAAALAWQSGRWEEAHAGWQKQPASVPVLFNRGMAALFLGKRAAARGPLSEAVGQLPEAGAWYHLGHLYLTLAKNK